jgi:hypothetical protein
MDVIPPWELAGHIARRMPRLGGNAGQRRDEHAAAERSGERRVYVIVNKGERCPALAESPVSRETDRRVGVLDPRRVRFRAVGYRVPDTESLDAGRL